MKQSTLVFVIVFIVLGALHQDVWNWDKGDKPEDWVFGFMPIGLAYHATYSIIAATFWALVTKFAWPHKLEEWAEGGD
jgi:hypothetical protein